MARSLQVLHMPWRPPHDDSRTVWSLDRPTTVHEPTRVLAIAAQPRSGSTLLGRALGATGFLGRPEEYFNPTIVARCRRGWGLPRLTVHGAAGALRRRLQGEPEWWRSYRYTRASSLAYRDLVVAATTSETGWFSVKMHWNAHAAFAGGMWDPTTWGIPVEWVRISRRDVLRQAISFVRARQSHVWESDLPATGTPVYSADEIEHTIDRMLGWEQAWDRFFDGTSQPITTVVYEELADDYEGQVRTVLDRLGLGGVPVPEPPLERQADEMTDEWVTRYIADRGVPNRP